MGKEKDKKIKFNDKTYIEKRQILRQYNFDNGFAYEMRLFILDEILQGLDLNIKLPIEEIVANMLVDGYIAYERIFDDKQTTIMDYIAVDPATLTSKMDGESFVWVQYADNEDYKRVLTQDQILYISYEQIIESSNTSLIGQIYTKQVKLYQHEKLNDFIINYIVKKIKNEISIIIKGEKKFFKKQ